ncbi:MAG: hypothetical protein H7222_16075 [Methylotenera sp.]|nr:hypothetical protein [Oligoflexia bacterium]
MISRLSSKNRSWLFCGLGLILFGGLWGVLPAHDSAYSSSGFKSSNQKRLFSKPWSTQNLIRDLAAKGNFPADRGCFYNQRMDLAILRQEIQEMEASLAPPKGTSPVRRKELIWNELDLSKFPVLQERYLTLNTDWFEVPEPRLIADCRDLFCVVDAVYGKKDSEEGVRLYHWYLRMGAPLVVSSKIPAVLLDEKDLAAGGEDDEGEVALSRSHRKLQESLFKADELKAFSILSESLSPSYRRMWSLQEIHRLPNGMHLGPGVGADYRSSQGWKVNGRTGAKSAFHLNYGYIRLIPDQMRMSTPPSVRGDYLFQTVAHEMTHAIDYVLFSPKFEDADTVSTHAEWMGFSGWKKVVVTDPVTHVSTWHWEMNPGHELFAEDDDYAQTSPEEDFAEAAMNFRLYPEKMLPLPLKSAYIAQHIYQGRRFDVESLKKFYLEQMTAEASSRLPSMVEDCSGQADCLDLRLQQSFERSVRFLQKTELEACQVLDENLQAELAGEGKEALLPKIGELLEHSNSVAKIRADIEMFQKYLSAEVDPREAYVACYGQELSSENCYTQGLASQLDQAASKYSGESQSWVTAEKQKYLKQAPFSLARARVERDTDEVLLGVHENLTLTVLSLWERCTETPAEPDLGLTQDFQNSSVLTPFTAAEQYVALSILNCVNVSLKSELRKVAIAGVARPDLVPASPFYGIAVERLLVQGARMLSGFLQKDAAEELLKNFRRKAPILTSVSAKLRSLPAADLKASCDSLANDQINSLVEKSLEVQPQERMSFRFNSRSELVTSWSEGLCKELLKTVSE